MQLGGVLPCGGREIFVSVHKLAACDYGGVAWFFSAHRLLGLVCVYELSVGGEKEIWEILPRKVYHWLDMRRDFSILYVCIDTAVRICG